MRIMMFDRSSNQVSYVGSGDAPVYVPSHRKLFFYRYDPEAGRTKLFLADWGDMTGTARVVDGGPFSGLSPVIPIDENRVIFMPRDDTASRIKVFDIRLWEISELPFSGCSPALWRAATKQLVCFDFDRQEFVLTDLSGKDRAPLWPIGVRPVTYVEEVDAVIVGYEDGLNNGVALYSFSDDVLPRFKILMGRTPVGIGGAIVLRQ
jgi:hypothetical protein